MNTTPSSIWHLMAATAQLAHEQLTDLPMLAQRVKTMLFESGLCPQGAILRLDHPQPVLASWGITKRAASQLASVLQSNGTSAVPLPDDWRSVTLGDPSLPGLLAVNIASEQGDDVLMALGAQISVLWQYAITRQEFGRRERAIITLTDTLQGMARQVNIDVFLQTVITQATELLLAAGGGMYLLNPLTRQLELRQVAQLPKKHVGTKITPGTGVVGQVAQTGQSMLVYKSPLDRSGEVLDRLDFSAILAAPLRDNDTVIGVIALIHVDTKRTFTPSDLALLESFAAQASLALRTASLFDAQRKQARELFVLYENSRTVGSSLDLRHILDRLTENVTLALNVEQSAVLLWDAEHTVTELVAVAVDEAFTGAPEEAKLGTRAQLQAGSVAALVINTQQPVAIHDVARDPRIAAQRGLLRERGIRSVLGVPLLVLDQVIGVLLCTMYSAPRTFSGSEITLAQTLAGQAATAIGNARLLSDERRRGVELAMLQEISTRLNAGSGLSATMEALGEGVLHLFSNIDLEICLYDPQTETLNSHYATEHTRTHYVSETGVYQIDQGLTGWLARHRMALRIDDIRQQRTALPIRADRDDVLLTFRSFLGVPMLVGDELIGTLELVSSHIGRFDAEDERLLKIIASQAAQALRNVRRYEATDEVLRERVRELLALQRISRELTSTLQLEQLLPAMLTEIVQATNCAHGMVVLREDETQPYTIIAQIGYPEDLDTDAIVVPLLQAGPIAERLAHAESAIIDDVSIADLPVTWPNVYSLLISPILYENRVAGAIIASDVRSSTFDRAALDFVGAVADQAALAIGNAQHYAEQVRQRELLQQRASLLNEVLEIGNALRADMELTGLLEQIAFSVTEAAGFREVVFSLIDPDQPEMLRTVSGAGLTLTELAERRNQAVPVSAIHPYLDPQYRIGRAYFVPINPANDAPRQWSEGDKLLVPLYSTERELIGVMSVDDPFTPERPTRRMVETLEIFANQAAIAVENTRLFSQRSRQIAELGVVNRISRAATSSLDFDSLAREVYEVLHEALPVESYFLVVFNAAADSIIESWGVDNGQTSSDVLTGPIARESLIGWISQHVEPLLFTDLPTQVQQYAGMTWQAWGEDIPRSWVGMPLLSGDGSIRGVLSLQHNEPNRYSERDVALLHTVANQLAVAVENARLYGDAQRRLGELALVNRIGSLTNSTLNMVDILTEVYRALRSVLPISAFFSFVYDPVRAEVVQRVNVDEGEVFIESQREKLSPQSPSYWITANLKPLLFSDMPVEIEGRFVVRRFGNPDKWVRSWIGVPLKINDDTSVGMISVQHYQANMYSERELSLLQTIASQVALAVHNARLFNDRERQIRELDAISQIGQLMSASLDLNEMLGQTANYLQQVTGAPIFYTMMYDAERNLITDGFAIEEGIVDANPPRDMVVQSGSLSAWVLSRRAALVIADLNDGQIMQSLDITPLTQAFDGLERDPRSWVGVPIVAKDGAPIGMLTLQDYTPNTFDERTVTFLTNVASHISLGLQKVQLFGERDRQIKELEAIRRVGQVTSSTLNLNEMVQGVYTVLTEFLPVEGFVVNIYDRQRESLVYNLLIDKGKKLDVPLIRPVKPGSMTDWMLTHRQPLLFRHLDDELQAYPDITPLQHGEGPTAQSWIGVPLLDANEQPLGMLALQNYAPGAFDERDMQFLNNVAYQVTLGMQNVRLYEQTQQGLQQLSAEAERLALINHVSNLTASIFDPQVLYNLAVEEMAHATGADQARLLIFDYEKQTGSTRAEFPPGDLSIEVPIENNATIPWLQEHRRPLIINDVDRSPLTESFRSTLHYLAIKRLLLVPIIVKGEMIGSVGLDSFSEDKEFTSRDAETCQTIANQVAQALENTRLFAETERQSQALSKKVGELSVLLEAGQALSSTREPGQVLDTLVRLVARQLQVDTVLLSALNNDQLLTPLASLGMEAAFVETMQVKRGQGLIGYVAEQGQPLAIADVQHDSMRSLYPDFNTQHGLVSFLGVPVLYRNEVMGVLSVMTNTQTAFTTDDVALLSALADQAAIAIENSRLFTERERQITVLQALNDVTQAITSTLDPQTLLRQLHTKLGLVVDTRYSFIALYDNDRNLLSFPVIVDTLAIEQAPLPLADGVLSRVVRGQRTIVLSTFEETTQASRLILGNAERMASWIGVPIMLGEQVLGVINIQSYTPHAFPPEQVQFLQAVASQTAIALENARLFSERERQIAEAAILASISQSITATLTPEELATSILAGLKPVFDTSNAYIVLYDAPTNMISTTVGYNRGLIFSSAPQLLTNDFLKTLLFEQRPLMYNSLDEQRSDRVSPRFSHLSDEQMIEAHSVIAAPITMGSQTSGMMINQPLGVLVVQSEQANVFDRAQLHFLESVANQSSNAVQKAMLFSERERRIRELDTLNRISQSITSSINLEEILGRLHTGLNEIVDMSTSYIGLYDAQSTIVTYEQTFDQGQRVFLSPTPLGVSTISWVIEHRQPLLLNTAAEADEYRDEQTRRTTSATRVGRNDRIEQSYLIVPIMVGTNVLGIINIQSYEQYAFSEYDMGFVSTVAAQAAASIANARLFEARERSIQQLGTLSSIGQALGSTVRFEDLLRVIYEQTSLLVDTSNFYIAIYDDRHKEVSFPLFYERGKAVRIEPRRNFDGLTEYIIRTRQSLLLQGDPGPQMQALGVSVSGDPARSWLGIPLIAADKVVGVLCVQSYTQHHAYSDDDKQLLSTIANQAAQALENARLFSESRESVRELSTLSETSVSLASTLDIAELLVISASSAIEMARADFSGVIVLDNDGSTVLDSLVLNQDRVDLSLPSKDEVNVSELQVLRPLRQGQVVTIYDANSELSLAPLTGPLQIRGVVFLPMMRENMLRGVVFVGMDAPYTFEDRSVASLLILTTQISQAVNNAQLFEQIRHFNLELEEIVDQRTLELKGEKERVEALYNIATELGTTLDRDELLVRTLDMAANALGVSRGSVLLLDRETKQLICHAILNEDLGLRSLEAPVVFEHGDGLANWVIQNNEGVFIDDVRHDPRWASADSGRGEDVRSVIAVPLLSSDAPQGVLMLNSTVKGYFTGDHLRFLSTIGGEVSSALHNADLYTLVYESADRLSDAMWQQREEASKTSAILQSVSEGVMVLDHDTERIILYNPAAEEVLRIPGIEVIDRSLSAVAAPRNEVELHEEGRALLLYTGLHEGIQAVHRNEAIHTSIIELPGQMIAANFAPVTGEDGSRFGVVVVLRDITREIEADRAKRDFIATVSHELRTPLTPIRGFVDLLMLNAGGPLTDAQRDMLGTIKANTMRMVSLVEDLLEIGRLEAGKISLNTAPANINQMVRDTVSMWNLELQNKRMVLNLELDDTLPLIEYDTKRIGQVLTNLVSNAIKYTYAAGIVTIRTFRNSDGMMQLDVQDTGVGLTAEQQKNLFKRFYRADSPLRDEVGGTGLGLSIAKSFVELHHGDMWVESVYSEGSTFSFSLPEQQPRPDLGEREDMGDIVSTGQPIEETTA